MCLKRGVALDDGGFVADNQMSIPCPLRPAYRCNGAGRFHLGVGMAAFAISVVLRAGSQAAPLVRFAALVPISTTASSNLFSSAWKRLLRRRRAPASISSSLC